MTINDNIKILISAYIDGEVTPAEKETVEALILNDAEAQKYYKELKKLSSSLQSWNNEALSPDLEQKINKNYLAKKQEGREMKTSTGTKIKIASTVIIALIVISVSMSTQLYLKRGIQGRFKSAADQIGDQFAPGNTNLAKVARAQGGFQQSTYLASPTASLGQSVQYEPYYLAEEKDIGGVVIYPPIGPYPVQPTDWNTEQYNRIYENEYLEVAQNPLSTFSIDVDTASYSNIRRFLQNNQMPPEDSVRIEEMINYFSYDYPEPTGDDPFSITTEVATCPWNAEHKLALIGLQGKRLKGDEMPPSNLVFLIDVSGSMQDQNKLPLLQQAFRMMVGQLRANDTISIAVYAGAAGKVLDPTSGDQKQTILSAIDSLRAGGSTAGAQGIQLAYELAKKNFIKDGNNRVILATDGDFNVGVSSDGELTRIIEEKRKDGIFLTILGFGMGNYKDSRLEQLADKGNGNYYYIDTLKEAKKVMVQELGSALFTIAKDVKIQIEFNPTKVKAYRLIGYETRLLNKEDFNDDKKDAGELGTGHTVTALYEIVTADSKETFANVDPLKYQTVQVAPSDELMTVKLRYKKPDEDVSKLISKVINAGDIQATTASNNLAWASSVAEFGMILRNSKFKGNANYQETLKRAQGAKGEDKFGYRQEMIDLIQIAEGIDVRNLSTTGGINTK